MCRTEEVSPQEIVNLGWDVGDYFAVNGNVLLEISMCAMVKR